jgi:hypothetical protein
VTAEAEAPPVDQDNGEDEDGWERSLSSAEVCRACPGLTYRQLDYWCRQRRFGPGIGEAHGSGTPRRFPPEVVPMIRAGLILSRFGLNGDACHNAMTRIRALLEQTDPTTIGSISFDLDGYDTTPDQPGIVVPLAALTS